MDMSTVLGIQSTIVKVWAWSKIDGPIKVGLAFGFGWRSSVSNFISF